MVQALGLTRFFSENCLIGHDGVLKLADFGFARDVGIGDSLSDTFCGSTVYAAPEILTATDMYDPRWADAWSCGVVLYAMLTAKMPYAREQLAKFVKFQYVDGKKNFFRPLFKRIFSPGFTVPHFGHCNFSGPGNTII